jgi:ABC-type sugar transport system substrate-binding protein
MKMKKVFAVLISMIFVLSLVACGGKDTADDKKGLDSKTTESKKTEDTKNESQTNAQKTSSETGTKKIGLVQINNTNSYYIGASQAFHEAAEYFGYTLDEQFCENSLENEISIIENFIELKYDVIIADPQDAEALEDVFQRGKDAGIIMVALRSPMENADYNCLINHYNGFYGATIAGCELIGGKGKVLLLEGQIGHEASDSRTKAFFDVLEKYPDVEVVDQQPCDWDPTKATNIVESWVTKYGDSVDAIFCETDGATPSVVNAISNAGLTGKVHVIGNDGEVECLEYMTQGLIDVEAFFSSLRDGYNCMVYVDAILRGVNVEKTVYLPLYTVCSEELQAKVTAFDPNVKVCSPEEALDKTKNYDKEFLGLYD